MAAYFSPASSRSTPGFLQDRDLFGLDGELALEPSIFLAELAFAVSIADMQDRLTNSRGRVGFLLGWISEDYDAKLPNKF